MAYIQDGILNTVVSFRGDIERCRKIGGIANTNIPVYFIERVTASPNMGVTGAFTFGKWSEAVECTAILTGRPVHMVRPQVWQNAIGVFSGGDKQKLFEYAKKLYTTEYEMKMFNKSTSDAVLIAYYGWRYLVAQEDFKNAK